MRVAMLFVMAIALFAAKPRLLLLKVYKDQNISGWVMSEKLDGIRAYWDGRHLISRSGKIIHAPKWFLKGYPPFPIDGELWTKRGDFDHIASIVNDEVPGDGWKQIKHYIFEVPGAKGDLFSRLTKVRPFVNEHIEIIKQIPVKSRAQLMLFLKEIEAKGGEGVVVRDPKAPYIARRTGRALKVKSFLDTECKVIGYNKGKGKYEGMVGSLRCQLPNGVIFSVGSGLTKLQRLHPPAIGSIITFQYKEWTKSGKPRFPVFLRVRR